VVVQWKKIDLGKVYPRGYTGVLAHASLHSRRYFGKKLEEQCLYFYGWEKIIDEKIPLANWNLITNPKDEGEWGIKKYSPLP